MRPSVRVRRVTSARAAGDGTYRSCLIACSTRARVAGRTLGRSFSTRETVWWDTPASRATSKIVATLALSSRSLILAALLPRASARSFSSIILPGMPRSGPAPPRLRGPGPPKPRTAGPTPRPLAPPGSEHLLQDDEHEQQQADEDLRPPRRERALERDDRLDDPEHEDAEHRSEHEPV